MSPCAMVIDCDDPESRMFMCGPGVAIVPACATCSVHSSSFLCDMPMGDGKTCDLPLCRCCAFEIGEDRHLCPIHYATWKPGTRLNPKLKRRLASRPGGEGKGTR